MGYGDRPDIALIRDRQQGEARDRAAADLFSGQEAAIQGSEWGTALYAKKLSTIAIELIEKEKARAFFFKEQVVPDLEWGEAVEEACIRLGLGSEDFSPHFLDLGDQVELSI